MHPAAGCSSFTRSTPVMETHMPKKKGHKKHKRAAKRYAQAAAKARKKRAAQRTKQDRQDSTVEYSIDPFSGLPEVVTK